MIGVAAGREGCSGNGKQHGKCQVAKPMAIEHGKLQFPHTPASGAPGVNNGKTGAKFRLLLMRNEGRRLVPDQPPHFI